LTLVPPHFVRRIETMIAFCSLILPASSARTPCRHAEIDAYIKDMTDTGTATRYYQQLVFPRQFTDFFHERKNHFPSEVDDSVPSNLYNVQIGDDFELECTGMLFHQPFADQSFTS
jgi:hypothetical protein